MSKKLLRKFVAIAAAMTMAVSSTAIGASAEDYKYQYQTTTFNTSGGTAGKASGICYVFKNHYSKTQGAPERTSYGVHGNLTKSLLTNWTVSGTLTTNSSLDFNITATENKSNSCVASRVETGPNQYCTYEKYNITMRCSSTELGSYTYSRNGNFDCESK